MNKLQSLSLAVFGAAFLAAGVASAQTPANVIAWNGNGTLLCGTCIGAVQLTVLVTDANGNPIPNTTVNWSIPSGTFGSQVLEPTTQTDANGMSQATFLAGTAFGLPNLQSFAQTTITATAGSASTNFTVTQAIPDQTGQNVSSVQVYSGAAVPSLQPAQSISVGNTLQGQAGSTATLPIKILVLGLNASPVPNVAVNLFNLQTASTGPVVQCGGPNAINGTVLTDQTGVATCYPTFGGTPGSGQFDVLVGAAESNDPTTMPQFFASFPVSGSLGLIVTPGQPGSFKLVTANNPSVHAGQSTQVQVQVLSSAGSGLAGQTVNWSVAPAGAATLASPSSTTDSNGNTTNTVTLASSASGTITVTAKLANSSLAPVTFNVTAIPNVVITGISAVSGSGQMAIVNAAFTNPLVVQVSASNGTAANVPVQFSVSGPATLSATTVNTNSSGVAQVNVTAGSTPGNVTVTASVAGVTTPASFSLTVIPPGPSLTVSGFLNGADLQQGSISPCSLATIVASGISPGIQNMLIGSPIGPLPTSLGGTQVTFNNIAAPISSIGASPAGPQSVTVQVPCELQASASVPVAVSVSGGSASISVPVKQASPGVFENLLSNNTFQAVIVRPDGSFVTAQNPARRGETVVAFATGLGPSIPAVPTGELPPPGISAMPQYQVVVGMQGGGAQLISAQLSPDRVGVWMVTFVIPQNITPGPDVTFSIGVIPPGASAQIPSGTSTIPVQ